VLAHCLLRACFLGTVVVLATFGALSPVAYVALLACSSLLTSWGSAGQYTMLAQVGGDDGRLAANSFASAQVWLATIVGPVVAGVLLARISPAWLLGLDAATFAFLGAQAWRVRTDSPTPAAQRVEARTTESGFRLLRRNDLLGLIVLTWLFFFLYGPVEDALPVYVARDLHAHAGLLGVYWTGFGTGALVSTLVTGALCGRATRRVTLLIVAGWGACLVPFAFAPAAATVICFAVGGLVYGPFIPLTYALLQSITTTANLTTVLAARSAAVIVAAPLGTALGGPIVSGLGARWTLTASGAATVLLAAVATIVWRRGGARERARRNRVRDRKRLTVGGARPAPAVDCRQWSV
jgi:predicted MFS family arabinose efflux permease